MDILDDKMIDKSLIGDACKKDNKYLLSKLVELLSYRNEKEIEYILERLNLERDFTKLENYIFVFLDRDGNIEPNGIKERMFYKDELTSMFKLADENKLKDFINKTRKINTIVKPVDTNSLDFLLTALATVLGYGVIIYGGAELIIKLFNGTSVF